MAEILSEEESIFHAALEIAAADQRSAYLDAACGDQEDLRRRVEALLNRYVESQGPLDRPPVSPVATSGDSAAERLGTMLGPYKLLEQIGEGGMGLVFLAEQLQPVRRRVALKVLKPGMDSKQVVARFEAERQALALMDHANIARVFDARTTQDGRPYFVMELVKGVPITDFCDQHRLTPRQRLELFVPVCRAVQHAHQKGIIHRDLKPSNILVALHDTAGVPKVIDFGIAKATTTPLTDKTLFTHFAQMIGTPLYMSPEQAEVNGLDVDTRTDVYSLGVLLYELLTGTTPLEKKRLHAAALLEVLRLIREEEPPKPSTRLTDSKETLTDLAARRQTEPGRLAKAVKGELDWIVMRCLEKDRTRRYDSAGSLARDVERYLADEPIEAGPPSSAYRLKKFARRNRAALATAVVLAAALVTGTAVSVWQAAEADRARRLADERLTGETQAHADAQREGKKAEANFQQALDAVDRMLAEVASVEVSAVPQAEKLRQRLLADAVEFYTGLIDRSPDAALVYLKRAEVYSDPGKADLARRDNEYAFELDRSLKLQPINSETRYFIATNLRNDGRSREAAAEFRKVAELASPGSIAAYYCLGEADWADGDYQSALASLTKCLEQTPTDPAGRRWMGWVQNRLPELYLAMGEEQKYLEASKRATELPGIPSKMRSWIYWCRGRFFNEKNDYAVALPELSRCVELAPWNSLGYKERALSHFQLGHFPEALADATKAIEINPGDTSTLWWIPAGAMAGCPDKTFRQAFLALADRAIELLSNQPDTLVQAYLVRSRLHAVLNYPERAQADCGQAVALYIRQLEKQDDAQGADRRDAFQSPNQPTQHYGPTGAIEHDAPVLLNLLQGERKGAMPPDADGLLALLGWTLLEQHQYAEAEMVLRECLAIRTEKRPPSGLRFDTQSMLGGALLGQQRYAEAEPLLRQGYEGLKQYYLHIAAGGQRRAEAAERLVELYEATGEPDKANEWRKKLAEAKASAKTPDKK